MDHVRKIERLQGALRDIVGVVPASQRDSVREDIEALEQLINEHSRVLDRMRQISVIAGA